VSFRSLNKGKKTHENAEGMGCYWVKEVCAGRKGAIGGGGKPKKKKKSDEGTVLRQVLTKCSKLRLGTTSEEKGGEVWPFFQSEGKGKQTAFKVDDPAEGGSQMVRKEGKS